MMEESLVNRMTSLGNRLRVMPQRFGLPQYQKVVRVIKHSLVEGSLVAQETYTTISPNPCVQIVPMKLVGTPVDDSVMISRKDLLIEDIGLNYSPEDLQGEWEVDGKRGYSLLQLIPQTTTYKAILKSPAERP